MQQMVVSHSILSGARWYEIRNINTNGSTPTLYQQGTFPNPTGGYRFIPTMAMDKTGSIGMGYAESSSTSIYPSIGIAGRLASDPLGVMPYGPTTVVSGAGSLTTSRYGDYASMQVRTG